MAKELETVVPERPEVDERIRKIIWSGIGHKTVRQMADETGLTPEQVHSIRREELESIDDLSIQQRITKALVTMQEIAETALEKSKNIGDERNFGGIINAAVNAQEKILKQLRAMRKEDTSKVEALNELRVRELLSLIHEVVEVSVTEISGEHGLDADELYEVFNVNLVQAARKRDMA